LHERLKRADIPAKVDILCLIKENMQISKKSKLENLSPYCFYTDGGTYNDDYYYFLHNIFSRSSICHSTKVAKNANIQAYIGRKVMVDPTALPPKNHKVKGEANQIQMPYEQYFADKNEDETFK
jgi:hypothetical protein